MNILGAKLKSIAILLLFVLAGNFAHAETLKEIVSRLKILPVNYGINKFSVNGKEIIIIKSKLETGTAWAQDHYTVFEQEKDIWKIIRSEKNLNDDVVARNVPHTYEDSIAVSYFMRPTDDADENKISKLYLLKVSRKYKETPGEIAPAELSLLTIGYDDPFGIKYFKNIQTVLSKNKYCNADAAAYSELNIPFSTDGKAFPCEKN